MCKTKSGNILDKTTYLYLYVASLWARHGARYQVFNSTTYMYIHVCTYVREALDRS